MASSKRASSAAWSDLPSDLLGLVLPRLHSLADRVRVGAVCRPWRSGAHLHPNLPPPMPWLAVGDEAYLDVVNNGVRKLSLQVPVDASCRGGADHLLFLTRSSGGCFLADPFSGAVLPIADLAMFIMAQTDDDEMFPLRRYSRLSLRVHKVVLLWPDDAPPVVAALIMNDTGVYYKTTIFVCRAGTDITGVSRKSYGGTMSVDLRNVKDVAFFRGNIYALSTHDQLLVVELGGEGPGGNPTITGVKYVIESEYGVPYDDFEGDDEEEIIDFVQGFQLADVRLVQSGDQLLMLKRWVIDDGTSRSGSTGIFDVYEADFGASPCRWKAVHSLHGRALFLGRHCSKSVPVGDGHYGAQEDGIYFIFGDGNDDSGIYDMEYCKVRPLVPDDTDVPWHWQWQHKRLWTPTRVFPDQSKIQAHYLKKSTAQGASDDDDRDAVARGASDDDRDDAFVNLLVALRTFD